MALRGRVQEELGPLVPRRRSDQGRPRLRIRDPRPPDLPWERGFRAEWTDWHRLGMEEGRGCVRTEEEQVGEDGARGRLAPLEKELGGARREAKPL